MSRTGYARDLLSMGIDGTVQLVASAYVLDETRRNLARKSPDAVPFFDLFLELDVIHVAHPSESLVREIALRVEPKDAAIVAGAIVAQCPVIATYDRRHLLAETEQIYRAWELHVETPRDIVQRLSHARDDG